MRATLWFYQSSFHGNAAMRTYYQVYRDRYWYTSTLDKDEAFAIAEKLTKQGFEADVRVEGRSVLPQYLLSKGEKLWN